MLLDMELATLSSTPMYLQKNDQGRNGEQKRLSERERERGGEELGGACVEKDVVRQREDI
jgi:hypothetical protein